MNPFDEIKKLRAENEELKEQIKDLKRYNDDDENTIYNIMNKYQLPRIKSMIIYRLACGNGRVIEKYLLHENIETIDVYVCRLRKIFGKNNIVTMWGRGYYMTKELCQEIINVASGKNEK